MRGLPRLGTEIDCGRAPRHLVGSYISASQLDGAVLDVDWHVGERRRETLVADEPGLTVEVEVDAVLTAEPEPEPRPAPPAETVLVARWEYLIVPLKDAVEGKKKARDLSAARLNDLGAEGWEAVGLALKKGARSARPVVLLKRLAS